MYSIIFEGASAFNQNSRNWHFLKWPTLLRFYI